MKRLPSRWRRSVVILGLITGLAAVARAGGREHRPSPASQLRYGPGVTNHPVNVVPSSAVQVPAGWPLGPDGAITCLTCHSRLPSLGGGDEPCLRGWDDGMAGPGQFCAKCHNSGEERSAASMHWQAVAVAHVQQDGVRTGHAQALEAESRTCLGCHDGVNASESSNATLWNRGPGSLGDMGRNHPIGVEYPDHPTPGATVRLRPAASLPPRVRLPDGRVSCVSCHDLYNASRYRLSVPIEESALCFTCHDMD